MLAVPAKRLRIEDLRRSMHAVGLRTGRRVGPLFLIVKTIEIRGFGWELREIQVMKSRGVFSHAQQSIDRCLEVQVDTIGGWRPDAESPTSAGKRCSTEMRICGWGFQSRRADYDPPIDAECFAVTTSVVSFR